jgi:hypothetical protein
MAMAVVDTRRIGKSRVAVGRLVGQWLRQSLENTYSNHGEKAKSIGILQIRGSKHLLETI